MNVIPLFNVDACTHDAAHIIFAGFDLTRPQFFNHRLDSASGVMMGGIQE